MSVVEQGSGLPGATIRLRRRARVEQDGSGSAQSQPTVSGNVRVNNRLVVVALGLGGCVDILFYRKPTGISTLLFVGLVLGALFLLSRREGVRVAWRNMWLLVPLLFFAAMVAVRASETLTWLNLTAVALLLIMTVAFFVEGRVEQLGLLGFPATVARTIREMLARPAPLAATARRSAAANHNINRRAGEIVRGILIAVPILLLFTLLLSSADAVFEGYVAKAMELRFLSDMPEAGLRIAIILCASWAAAGALLHVTARRHNTVNTGAATGRLTLAGRSLGFVEAALVLGLVNGLFALFAWIQFTVLFSGQAALTMGFEEYREYVRRGFGELLVVAVLTMVLILGLRRAVLRATEGQQKKLNILNSIMIGLALVMLVSAFERMVVWENIQFYINTTTRIFVRAFIVWLGLLFVWLLFTSWVRRRLFAIGAFLAMIGFLATINLINPDAEVAAYNIHRNDELSTRYLYLLSDDAIPAIASGLATTTGEVREQIRVYLAATYWNMHWDKNQPDWIAFHFARQEAWDTLAKLQAEGKLRP